MMTAMSDWSLRSVAVMACAITIGSCGRLGFDRVEDAAVGWSMEIVIDTIVGANLPATALENDVPIAVRLDANTFDFSVAPTDGAGIWFVDGDGVDLPHEVERWDSAAKQSTVWVLIPEIRGDSVQSVFMRWGDGDVVAAGAVFDSKHGDLGVWHLSPRGGQFYDSTSMRNDLIQEGTLLDAVEAGGVLSGGVRLGVGAQLRADISLNNKPHWSYSVWFRADTARDQSRLIGLGSAIRLSWGAADTIPDRVKIHVDLVDIDEQPQGYQVAIGPAVVLSEWTYAVANYDQINRSIELFVNDGTSAFQSWNTHSIQVVNGSHGIGGAFSGQDYEGRLDEVRISDKLRSADWVRLTYENQRPMQRLLKLGPLQQVAPW